MAIACSPVSGTTVGATTTTNPAANTLCGSTPNKDVWFKVTIPSTGILTIRTTAGTLIDAVMAIYVGSCTALTYANICEDDNTNGNGSTMPVVSFSGPVGTIVHIRIWGYNGATGTFTICALNSNVPNLTGEVSDGVNDWTGEPVVFELPPVFESDVDKSMRIDAFTLHPNPATDMVRIVSNVIGESAIEIFDLSGKRVYQQSFQEGDTMDINTNQLNPGVYFVVLHNAAGRNTQKLIIQR